MTVITTIRESFLEGFKSTFSKKHKTPATPLKKENFFYRNRYVFLAFAIPLVLMLYAFANAEFYPFGDNQILVIDMWHQYFPFMNEMHTKLQSGGSMLYTWNGGLGTNFIALISYYAASPLYLLTIFCPTEYLTEAMAVIVALKIAFAGAFMCIYLRGMFQKCDIGTVAFSVLYALCAYAMGYYWCLMWLDVLALLPLCLLGLNKLIDEGKFRMYTISLAMILITNYYIGVMVCIFILIYYPVLYFSRLKARGAKGCAIVTLKAVLFSALGIMMAAIILIPTYLSMQNTYYMGSEMPTNIEFYNPLLDVFSNLLPQVELTVRGGLPNIYCGLISAMLAVLFLLCKKIPTRQKILNCAILCFLVLSFNWRQLDFIWHGMHFPNELPYRYSFCFSFILITMAYQAFLHLKDITPAQIGGVTAGGFIYILVAEKLYSETFDYKVIYIGLLFLALYAIALAIYKSGKFTESVIGILLFLIVFGEMTLYTVDSVKAVGSSSRSYYFQDYEDIRTIVNRLEEKDDQFFRMELQEPFTSNPAPFYGYRGISQFSSEINCHVSQMMKNIGLAADPGSNSFLYYLSTPVVNSMLNVKYIVGKAKTISDGSLTKLFTEGASNAYLNKYGLSIAYMADNNIRSWDYNASNPFTVQSNYVKSATGTSYDLFERIGTPEIRGSNVSVGAFANGYMSCSPESASETSTLKLTFTSDKEQSLYAYVKTTGASSISATRSDGATVNFHAGRGSVVSLGEFEAGETVTVNINFEEGKASAVTCDVRALNQEQWDSAYAQLSDEMLQVTDFSDTKIEGTITASSDGVLMTSIPYEKGWSAKVDGQKVDIIPIGDAFVSLNLSQGTHEIEFSYMPDGFVAGVACTIGGALLLAALYFFFKGYEIRRKKMLHIDADGNMIAPSMEDTEFSAPMSEAELSKLVDEAFDRSGETSSDKIVGTGQHNLEDTADTAGSSPPGTEGASAEDDPNLIV